MAKSRSPFVSNPELGIWFWVTGGREGEPDTNHSSHPHELLPFYCRECDWWTDRVCPAHRPGEQMAMFRRAG